MHFATIATILAVTGTSLAVNCNIGSAAKLNDAKTCADLLRGKGTQACNVNGGQAPPQMCHQGSARVYGVSNNGQSQSATCQNVAEAVDRIVNQCLGGGSGSGSENTSNNGNLRVEVHG